MSVRKYPKEPLISVGAAVFKGDKVLIIKRGNPPLYGLWSLPGGKVKPQENLKGAVIREVKEETNIEVEVEDLIKIFQYIEKDEEERVKYHYIVFDFRAIHSGGELTHSSDALEARWVSLDELKDYNLTEAVVEVIKGGASIK